MSYATWPVQLPEFVIEEGYAEQIGNGKLESSVDAGQPKARPRFTRSMDGFNVVLIMDATQKAAFDVFYKSTLGQGSLPFEWVHPVTRAAMKFVFRNPPPSSVVFGGVNYKTSFKLEEYR